MYIPLQNRGLIKVEGPEARDFLQGLVSQDMTAVTGSQALYSAFLTPQGKFLFDFFCFEMDGALMLDCEADRRSDFFKRLSMYKLRSDATLTDVSDDFQVYADLGAGGDAGACQAIDGGVSYIDPRLAAMGARVVVAKSNAPADFGDFADYERRRLTLGLADGSRDMSVDKALLLENGFEELNGVSFTKGCFMGQELTARTRYRGLVKKRLLPVSIDGPAPAAGSAILAGDKEAGEMKTSAGDIGVALMRLDRMEGVESFTCDGATLYVTMPDWVVLQKNKEDA